MNTSSGISHLKQAFYVLLLMLLISPAVTFANDEAIQAGNAFLVSQQDKDGSWSADQSDTFKQLTDTSAAYRALNLSDGATNTLQSADLYLRSLAKIDQGNQYLGPSEGSLTQDGREAQAAIVQQLNSNDVKPSFAHADLDSDRLARILSALGANSSGTRAILFTLINLQNEDGGWGLKDTKASDPLDTAVVIDSLVRAGYRDRQVLSSARDYLVGTAVAGTNTAADGSWRLTNQISDSDIAHTSMVLIALKDIELAELSNAAVRNAIDNAVSYLLNHNNGLVPDTSNILAYPTPESADLAIEDHIKAKLATNTLTVADVALAFDALRRVQQPAQVRSFYNVLIGQQDFDLPITSSTYGSWSNGDVLTTALVVQALQGYELAPASNLPDVVVDASKISFSPTSPPLVSNGQVTVAADVYNVGAVNLSSVDVRFFERSFDGNKVVDTDLGGTLPITINNLLSGTSQQAVLVFNAPVAPTPGRLLIGIKADPDGIVEELSNSNNVALAEIDINGTGGDDPLSGAGTDLAVLPGSISIAGADMSAGSSGQAILDAERHPTTTVSVRIDNLGNTATVAATLDLTEDKDNGDTIAIGSATIPPIEPGGSIDLAFVWWPRPDLTTTSAPFTTLDAQITPDSGATDYSVNNNRRLAVKFADNYEPIITPKHVASEDPSDLGDLVEPHPIEFHGQQLIFFLVENHEGAIVGAARITSNELNDPIELAIEQGTGLYIFDDKLFFETGTLPPGVYTLELELYDDQNLQFLELITQSFTINPTHKFGPGRIVTIYDNTILDPASVRAERNHIHNAEDGSNDQPGNIEVRLQIPNLSNTGPTSADVTLTILDPSGTDVTDSLLGAGGGNTTQSFIYDSNEAAIFEGTQNQDLDIDLGTTLAGNFDTFGRYTLSVAVDAASTTDDPAVTDHIFNVMPDARIIATKTINPKELRPFDRSTVEVNIDLKTDGQTEPPLLDVVIVTLQGSYNAGESDEGESPSLAEANELIIGWLHESSRVALVSLRPQWNPIDDAAVVDLPLTLLDGVGRSTALDAVSLSEHDGKSGYSLEEGLKGAIDVLGGSQRNKVIIYLTTLRSKEARVNAGTGVFPVDNFHLEVNRAIQDSITIHTVGFGPVHSEQDLREGISEPTGGTFRAVNTGHNVADSIRDLLADLTAAGTNITISELVSTHDNVLDENSIRPEPASIGTDSTTSPASTRITWEVPHIMLGDTASFSYRVDVVDPQPGKERSVSPLGSIVTFQSPFTGNELSVDLPHLTVMTEDIGSVVVEDTQSPGSTPAYTYNPGGATPTFDVTATLPKRFLGSRHLTTQSDYTNSDNDYLDDYTSGLDVNSVPGSLQLLTDPATLEYNNTGTAYLTLDLGSVARLGELTYAGSQSRYSKEYGAMTGHLLHEHVVDLMFYDSHSEGPANWWEGGPANDKKEWWNEATDSLAVTGHGLSAQDLGVIITEDVEDVIQDMTAGEDDNYAIEFCYAPIAGGHEDILSFESLELDTQQENHTYTAGTHFRGSRYYLKIVIGAYNDHSSTIGYRALIPNTSGGGGDNTSAEDHITIHDVATGGQSLNLGQRNHFAIIVSGTNAKVYLNGNSTPVAEWTDFPRLSEMNIERIVLGAGSSDSTVPTYHYGRIFGPSDWDPYTLDEVRLYAPGVELNQSVRTQHSSDMLNGIRPTLTPELEDELAAYWDFDTSLGYQRHGEIVVGDALYTGTYAYYVHERPVTILSGRSQAQEFPEYSHIVTTKESINIIDAVSGELWMQLLANRYIWDNLESIPIDAIDNSEANLNAFTTTSVRDGIIYVGTKFAHNTGGLALVNFPLDQAMTIGDTDVISSYPYSTRGRKGDYTSDTAFSTASTSSAKTPLLPESSTRVNDIYVEDVIIPVPAETRRVIAVATDTGLSLIKQGDWNTASEWSALVFGNEIPDLPNPPLFEAVGSVKQVQVVGSDVYFVLQGDNLGEDTLYVAYGAAAWTPPVVSQSPQVKYLLNLPANDVVTYGHVQSVGTSLTDTVTFPSNQINDFLVKQGGSILDANDSVTGNDNVIYVATTEGLYEIHENRHDESAATVRSNVKAYMGSVINTPFDTFEALATPNDNVISISDSPEGLWVATHWTNGEPGSVSLIDTSAASETDMLIDHISTGTDPPLPSGVVTVVKPGLIGTQQGALAYQRNLADPINLSVRSGYNKSDIDNPVAAPGDFTPLVGFQPGEAIDLKSTTLGKVSEGRYLQLEVTLNRDDTQPTITPVFEGFDVTYNDKTLAIDVDIEDSDGVKITDLATLPIYDTDLGSTKPFNGLTFDTSQITLDPHLVGSESFFARARLVDVTEDSVISQDTDEFKMRLDSAGNDLVGGVMTDRSEYTAHDTVKFTSSVKNINPSLPTSDVTVTLELFDDSSPNPIAKIIPAITYSIDHLSPNSNLHTRDFEYTVATTGDKLGTYTLKQTIDWGSPAVQQDNETTFVVSPGTIDPSTVLSGDITVDSVDLTPGDSQTTITASITNQSNVVIDDVVLEVAYLAGSNSETIHTTSSIPSLGVGSSHTISPTISFDATSPTLLASGSYPVVLKGAYEYNSERYPTSGFYTLDFDGFSFVDDRPPAPSAPDLHLRADLNVSKAPGTDSVFSWADRSSGGHTLSVPGYVLNDPLTGKEPEWVPMAINCLPVLRFDGSDVLEEAVNPSPTENDTYTIFIVAQIPNPSNVTANAALLASSSAGPPDNDAFQIEVSGPTDPKLQFTSKDASGGVRSANVSLTSDPFLLTIVRDNKQLSVYRNGELVADYTDDDLDNDSDIVEGYMLGRGMASGPHLEVDIAEVIVYSVALMPTDRLANEENLRVRYNLYNPQHVGDPSLWLRSDAGIESSTISGYRDRVDAWRDQSGFGNDATQANDNFPDNRPELEPTVFGCNPAIDFTQGNLEGGVPGPWDVTLVIDRSGSMINNTPPGEPSRLDEAKEAAATIIDQFLVPQANGSRVSLIPFESVVDTTHRVTFTSTPGDSSSSGTLLYKLDQIPGGGGTDFVNALNDAVAMHQVSTNTKVVYFLTDGLDSVWQDGHDLEEDPGRLADLDTIIQDFLAYDITVYPILLGNAFATEPDGLGLKAKAYLQRLADTTGGQLHTAIDGSVLEDVFLDIFHDITGKFRSMAVLFVPQSLTAQRQVLWAQGNAIRGVNVYIDQGELHVTAWNLPTEPEKVAERWGPVHISRPVEVNAHNYFELVYTEHTENAKIEGFLNGVSFGAQPTGAIQILPEMTEIQLGGADSGAALRFHDDPDNTYAGNSFEGLVGEVLYYSHALQDPERIITEKYIIKKYDLPPVANAGEDFTVVDQGNTGSQQVVLSGAGSISIDSPIATYSWYVGTTQIAQGENPTVLLALGTHDIQLTVEAEDNQRSTDTITVQINPEINSTAEAAATVMLIENTEFSDNTAVSRGGGLFLGSGSVLINHCTVSGNTGGLAGQGIFVQASASPTIANSIVWGNIGSADHDQLFEEPGSYATVTHCGLELIGTLADYEMAPNHITGTNSDLDPKFVSAPTNLHLDGTVSFYLGSEYTNFAPIGLVDLEGISRGAVASRIGAYQNN